MLWQSPLQIDWCPWLVFEELIENAKFSTKIKDGHLTENTTYSVRVDLTGLYICVVLMLTKHLYLQNGLT